MLLVLQVRSPCGQTLGLARLMSPAFQLSNRKTSCLVFQFKAFAPLRVLLGYVNISGGGGYEERLLHRSVKPMAYYNFLTLQRDVGGHTGVEDQQFVLVFESRGQHLVGELVIIREIRLLENPCNCTMLSILMTYMIAHDLICNSLD